MSETKHVERNDLLTMYSFYMLLANNAGNVEVRRTEVTFLKALSPHFPQLHSLLGVTT
jgi:hypothetical protein